MATGKIFVHDCTAVTSLDLFLFGAEPQVLHAQHRVIVDNWIEMRISPRTAVLFKALRRQLFVLMAERIEATDADPLQSGWGGRPSGAAASAGTSASLKSAASVQPGSAAWPPPLETREQAQAALLTALVWLIGKGVDLQVDELPPDAKKRPGGGQVRR